MSQGQKKKSQTVDESTLMVEACWTDGIFLETKAFYELVQSLGALQNASKLKIIEAGTRKRFQPDSITDANVSFDKSQVEIDCYSSITSAVTSNERPLHILLECKTSRRQKGKRGFIACWGGSGASYYTVHRVWSEHGGRWCSVDTSSPPSSHFWLAEHARLFEPSANKDSPGFIGKGETVWSALESVTLGTWSFKPVFGPAQNLFILHLIVTDLELVLFDLSYPTIGSSVQPPTFYRNVPAVLLKNFYLHGIANRGPSNCLLVNLESLAPIVTYFATNWCTREELGLGKLLQNVRGTKESSTAVKKTMATLWAQK